MSHEVSAASLQGDCSMERTSAMEDNNNKAATQAVQVAVNIRPLIAQERIQACKDCLKVMPHAPQVVCSWTFSTVEAVYLFEISCFVVRPQEREILQEYVCLH